MKPKTIVITGASQGLGRFLAVYFAQKGHRLVLLARNEAGLTQTLEQVEAAGGSGFCYSVDLSDVSSLERASEHIQDRVKKIDIIIHNAADVLSKPFLETESAEIAHLIQTNVTGPLQLTRLLLPMMELSTAPSIVHLSSLAGYKPNPSQTVYGITKTAVNGMSQGLRAELAPQGIHVLNVGLSSVGTDADTLKRGQVHARRYALLLESALFNQRDELFLSPLNKWLMRLYAFFPALMKLRPYKPH